MRFSESFIVEGRSYGGVITVQSPQSQGKRPYMPLPYGLHQISIPTLDINIISEYTFTHSCSNNNECSSESILSSEDYDLYTPPHILSISGFSNRAQPPSPREPHLAA